MNDKVYHSLYRGLNLMVIAVDYGINDYLIIKDVNDPKLHKLKIRYNVKGNPYIVYSGLRVNLSEFTTY